MLLQHCLIIGSTLCTVYTSSIERTDAWERLIVSRFPENTNISYLLDQEKYSMKVVILKVKLCVMAIKCDLV